MGGGGAEPEPARGRRDRGGDRRGGRSRREGQVVAGDEEGVVAGEEAVVVDRPGRQAADRCRDGPRAVVGRRERADRRVGQLVARRRAVLEGVVGQGALRPDDAVEGRRRVGDSGRGVCPHGRVGQRGRGRRARSRRGRAQPPRRGAVGRACAQRASSVAGPRTLSWSGPARASRMCARGRCVPRGPERCVLAQVEHVDRAVHDSGQRTGAGLARHPASAADGRDAVAPAAAEAPVSILRPQTARRTALGLCRDAVSHRGARGGAWRSGSRRAGRP